MEQPEECGYFERDAGTFEVVSVPRFVPSWLVQADLMAILVLAPLGLLCWALRSGLVVVVMRRPRRFSLAEVVGYDYLRRGSDIDAREREIYGLVASGAFDQAGRITIRERWSIVRAAKRAA